MAKFDFKDGFYHIPVHPKLSSLLGIKHPKSGKLAVYRVLCFGLKCAPFSLSRDNMPVAGNAIA